ncbi:MAG: hypothetical protein O2967_17385 [Proteobacteria bacterium]|nr:hypothetical protein [Pseudomonadota bacterium]
MTAGIVKLTERQFLAFIDDRLDGTGPCAVAEEVPLAALATTDVVPNARVLMAMLADGGGKLTAKGNFNRKLVETLMERFQWRGCDTAAVRGAYKAVNEHDFVPAMYLHAIFKLAGLARRRKGTLELTRKGRALLLEEAAGRLQAVLFRTTFSRYNLGYLDGLAMAEVFQPQISLILYLTGRFCTDWRPLDALMRSVTFPVPELTEPEYPNLPQAAFNARVLRYLCWFGLLEESRAAANDDWHTTRLYRKTPLYDRTLSFELLR